MQFGFGLDQLNAKQRFAAKDVKRAHKICPNVCLRFRLAHLLDRYIYRHIVIRPLAEISFLVHCETVAQHRRSADYFLPRFGDCPRVFLPLILKGCVDWAKENNVTLITETEMQIIQEKRAKEKEKKNKG